MHEPVLSELADAGMTQLYRAVELPLASVLVDMECTGVRLNVAYLEDMESEFAGRIEKLMAQIFDLAGEPFNVNSPKQLGQVLFERLGLPVLK